MKRFLKSFANALKGVANLVVYERNFRIHIVVTVIVIFFAVYFQINKTEWLVLILVITGVLVAEAINSAIEKMVDILEPRLHPQAGLIKNLAAGAVLLAATGAVILGMIIFLPYFFHPVI